MAKQKKQSIYTVQGVVSDQEENPVKDLVVRAFDQDPKTPDNPLGDVVATNAEGRYTISYTEQDFKIGGHESGGPDVFIQVYDEDGKFLASSEVVRNASVNINIDLTVPITVAPDEPQRIGGTVVLQQGLPVENLKLRLYRREFGGESTLLGETVSLSNGRYAFAYDPSGRSASLEVWAVGDNGQEVALSKSLNQFSSTPRLDLNLLAPPSLKSLSAEYQRLAADLTPHIGKMELLSDAQENDTQQDLTVLNRATGWDARLIALAATAGKISAETDLPQEPLYGLLRVGLPSDRQVLALLEPNIIDQALHKAVGSSVIQMSDEEVNEFKKAFNSFSEATRLAMPTPGSQFSYNEVLQATGLGDESQAKFASVFLHHQGDSADLWQKVREAGIDDDEIGRLQLQGKLAYLAGNSEPMTRRLLNKELVDPETGERKFLSDPLELVTEGFYRADRWVAELRESVNLDSRSLVNPTAGSEQNLEAVIPSSYKGESVEARVEAYAEDMARKVRQSYPTQVLNQELKTDGRFRLPSAHETTVTLLEKAEARGFRYGTTPASTFLISNPDLQDGLSEAEYRIAEQQVKAVQRVYQITPSDEAMPVLINLGMTSAYDIMAYSEEEFESLFVAEYLNVYGTQAPRDLVWRIRRKARQVSSVTYNLYSIGKTLESEPPLAGLSAPVEVRESVKNELIKHYPSMESLFGSMDFCECEHCRSVLSPAAYLVDLLQFVDIESNVWSNFLAHWKVTHGDQDYPFKDKDGKPMKPYDALIERRPDLPHISLTCENTHTVLPYIDVVNEILEFFVANGKLDETTVRNTEVGTTTEELLAEPQHVIIQAYDAVREARFPLNLPFDLWIHVVRQFCDYFETPFSQLLESFRPSDELFAPAQGFDRAVVFKESIGISPEEDAVYADTDPLANDSWHELYGFPSGRSAVANVTNTGDATLSIANEDARSAQPGLSYTFFDVSADALSNETLVLISVGDSDSGGAGQATLTFSNTWGPPPEVGDLLVCAVSVMLKSAKTLSRRLGITYKEITEIVKTNFVNPELNKLSLLYKLGVEISEARFYVTNKPLEQQDPDTLTAEDQKKRLEVIAFKQELQNLADSFGVAEELLETAIQGIPFDQVLVLADPDAACNFDETTLQYSNGDSADPIVFLRINLSIRLQRLLGWSIDQTDRALQAFVPATAPFTTEHLAKKPLESALIFMAHLRALDEKLKIRGDSLIKLITLWSDIATTGSKSLYEQLFLTPSVLKNSPEFDDPLGRYLTTAGVKLQDHMIALKGALGLTADEIRLILENNGEAIETADLTLSNVSQLYRHGLLAKALKVTVAQLIALKQLSGLDPFTPLHPDPLANLSEDHPFSQTLEFVTLVEEVKGSDLKIEDLDYLLRHRFDEAGRYRRDPEETLALLKSLSEGIRAIRIEHALPEDPVAVSDEVLLQKLGLVLPTDAVTTFMAMLQGTIEFTATKTGIAVADQLTLSDFDGESDIRELPYNEIRQEQKLTFRGVLFDAKKNEINSSFNPDLNPNQQALLAGLLGEVQQQAQFFFDQRLLKQPAGQQPASGFLEAADYELLFAPSPPGQTSEQQRARQRLQRTRLFEAFIPYLQLRLIEQFVTQAIIAYTAAEPVMVESLLRDEHLLDGPPIALNALAAVDDRTVTARFFPTADASGAASTTVSLPDADTSATDTDGNPLKPAGTNSAQLEGFFEVPVAGAYRFLIELDKQNAEAELLLPHRAEQVFIQGVAGTDQDTIGDQPDEYLELKPGVLYRYMAVLKNLDGGDARVRVQGESMPRSPLSQLKLYAASSMDGAERALTQLDKALQVVESLGLSEREIRYISTHASDFDNVSLSKLPTEYVGDSAAEQTATQERFQGMRRLMAYTRLKQDLAGGTEDLVAVFEANGTTAVDRLEKLVYPLIARISRRDEATVAATATVLFAVPDFVSEQPLQRLWDALQVVERFGVTPAQLIGWTEIVSRTTTPDRRYEIARELRESIKARFEPDVWHRVAQPIFDRLRQFQRDALTSYVMHQNGFYLLEQLYEYFLIDPGMEPVVQTSRIRLAIASLQLFIQRCLLNLEPKVHPSTVNAKHWEWMKRYRVWEANRKIFLFPENWLEPEFRDDKTHLFTELEGALLQDDVSSDLVEDAFLNYLRKLDELARLDIVAMHIEDNPDPARRVLHVFGRTFGLPHKYFYRRYAHAMWTPWEPVSAEIDGDHLAPVVWRDRLFLFWVTFLEKADPSASPRNIDGELGELDLNSAASSVESIKGKQIVEAHLHWSEYVNGEWTTRESGSFTSPMLSKHINSPFNPHEAFVHVSKEPNDVDGSELGVFIHVGGKFNRSFYLAGRNSSPESEAYENKPANPFGTSSRRATRYQGSRQFIVSFNQQIESDTSSVKDPVKVLGVSRKHMLVPSNNDLLALAVPEEAYRDASNPAAVKAAIASGLDEIATLLRPVFYQDNQHTFFVEPDVKEITIEEWEEWIPPVSRPEPVWEIPTYWDDLVVVPEIPWEGPIPDFEQPFGPIIDPGSVIDPAPDLDWLTNPATVVRYGDVVIGPAGQPGIEILTDSEAAVGREIITTNPGSDLENRGVAVFSDANAFAESGLNVSDGGLSVVGGGGFNSALGNSYTNMNNTRFGLDARVANVTRG